MSFLTLGIFWIGQQTQLNHLARRTAIYPGFTWAFSFAVTLTPFSTMLLAEFMAYRAALLVYWSNILLLGAILYGSWGYALRAALVKDELPAEVPAAICRRIVIAQAFYAAGALLCVINTRWSIAFILLVQLNYAVAPAFAVLQLTNSIFHYQGVNVNEANLWGPKCSSGAAANRGRGRGNSGSIGNVPGLRYHPEGVRSWSTMVGILQPSFVLQSHLAGGLCRRQAAIIRSGLGGRVRPPEHRPHPAG